MEMPREKPTHEGYLVKRSQWLKEWRRRYFRLFIGADGPRLFFSKGPADAPHGVIDLAGCLTVKSAEEKTGACAQRRVLARLPAAPRGLTSAPQLAPHAQARRTPSRSRRASRCTTCAR